MVNPQRPTDHEHLVSQEPDVEGHVLDPDGSEDSADRDADGPALTHLPPTDDGGDDDTEGNIAY